MHFPAVPAQHRFCFINEREVRMRWRKFSYAADLPGTCVNIYRRHIICPRHWSPACLYEVELSLTSQASWRSIPWTDDVSAINCHICSVVPGCAGGYMSRVGRQHMRTRLNTTVIGLVLRFAVICSFVCLEFLVLLKAFIVKTSFSLSLKIHLVQSRP